TWRLRGVLAVSRAFDDKLLKQYVSCSSTKFWAYQHLALDIIISVALTRLKVFSVGSYLADKSATLDNAEKATLECTLREPSYKMDTLSLMLDVVGDHSNYTFHRSSVAVRSLEFAIHKHRKLTSRVKP
ncbi:hypothetical protein AKJ16_DCAP27237, partial [Drosera capensis]